MDLRLGLTTTGAVRDFTAVPVDDATLARVLDVARFAPSGGNRQGWRAVVVKDPEIRRRLRDAYLAGWYEYLAQRAAGLTPWSPLADRAAEAEAIAGAPEIAAAADPDGFAEQLDRVPVLLALLVDLDALAAVDRDLDRYTFAGAASVYPFAWSVLLAARDEGLGGVLTTMAIRQESEALRRARRARRVRTGRGARPRAPHSHRLEAHPCRGRRRSRPSTGSTARRSADAWRRPARAW